MDATIEPQTFYGKPLKFTPGNHAYRWGGEPIPSVTAILGRLNKPALIQWAANCAVDHLESAFHRGLGVVPDTEFDAARKAHATIRDAAGDVGTQLHDYAKDLLQGFAALPPSPSPELERCARGLLNWHGEHDIRPVACERKILSAKYRYAGTCDFYGHIDGKLAVLDFKTGGERIYDEAWLQTSAYELALCEELGLDSDNIWRWVVHINKKTGKIDAQKRLTSAAHTMAWIKLVEFDQQMRLLSKEKAA